MFKTYEFFIGHMDENGVVSVLHMDINDLRVFIEKQSWIFAMTYANKSPHEYVVRGRINGTDEEFLKFIDYIRENGITMHYWGQPCVIEADLAGLLKMTKPLWTGTNPEPTRSTPLP